MPLLRNKFKRSRDLLIIVDAILLIFICIFIASIYLSSRLDVLKKWSSVITSITGILVVTWSIISGIMALYYQNKMLKFNKNQALIMERRDELHNLQNEVASYVGIVDEILIFDINSYSVDVKPEIKYLRTMYSSLDQHYTQIRIMLVGSNDYKQLLHDMTNLKSALFEFLSLNLKMLNHIDTQKAISSYTGIDYVQEALLKTDNKDSFKNERSNKINALYKLREKFLNSAEDNFCRVSNDINDF